MRLPGLDRLLFFVIRQLMRLWVRPQVLPADLAPLGIDPARPVCYVLQNRLLSNVLALETEAIRLGLPRPLRPLRSGGLRERHALVCLTTGEPPLPLITPRHTQSPRLVALVDALHADPALDVQLVPVNIFWGRAPETQSSWFRTLFADSWATPSVLKQLVIILLNGPSTLVKISPPLSLRQLCPPEGSPERAVRKVSRVLRVHFRRERTAAIGPDLSHRRTLLREVFHAEPVQAAIAREAAERGVSREVAETRARQYANEIAADASMPVMRTLIFFLDWLWTRLYDGVQVKHFEVVEQHARDHEVIYVPCHRSHIDYLLLGYVIFTRGYVSPHAAAGINLNIPVVGSLLRCAGAFFLRRSFKDNFLYSAVFHEYLHQMLQRGFPIKYFIEGGRSRTGRQLAPKIGMINMTLRSYVREHNRPLVFIPAYIGYEKLMEGRTYIGELQGKPKEKENLFALVRSVRQLKKVFGRVYLNFGEPILLDERLDALLPGWRDNPAVLDSPAFIPASQQIGLDISRHINAAADVNASNLLALVLLSTPRHAIDEEELASQLDVCKALLLAVPYGDHVTVTELDGRGMIATGERLRILQRRPHPLGDLLYLFEEEGVLMTYFRNSTLHLFALPSLIAVILLQHHQASPAQILHRVRAVYPFLRAELFLTWPDVQLDALVPRYLAALADLGLIVPQGGGDWRVPEASSAEHARLHILSRALRQTLVRYHMTITVLSQRGSDQLTQQQLEELCHLLAQRLSFVRELSAPEFFDKALFRGFLDTLGELGILSVSAQGRLCFDQRLNTLAGEALAVLPSGIRQAVLQVTQVTDEEVAEALQAVAEKKGRVRAG